MLFFYSLCNRCCPNHYSLQFRNHHHWKSCITFESKLSHSGRTKHTIQLWICKYSRIWIFNSQIWRIWYWKFYHFWSQFDKFRYIVVISEFFEEKNYCAKQRKLEHKTKLDLHLAKICFCTSYKWLSRVTAFDMIFLHCFLATLM